MPFPHILAFDPNPQGIIESCIPIVIFMIPIVAILTKHQQKMAEILHGRSQSNEILELQREVASLKTMVVQQAFALERLNPPTTTMIPPNERITTNY